MKNIIYKQLVKEVLYCVLDKKGIITEVSDALALTMKYPREELIGRKQEQLSSHYSAKETEHYNKQWETISSGAVWSGIVRQKNSDGKPMYFDTITAPLLSKEGDLIGYLSIKKDITDLIYKKHYCLLTGLRNKTTLKEDLSEHSDKSKLFFAIVDIDDFSTINNIYGGEVGNSVLVIVSQKLSKVKDFIAYRIKDDEFGLLYSETLIEGEENLILSTLTETIESIFRDDVIIKDKSVNIRVTVGASYAKPLNLLEYSNLAFKEARKINCTSFLYPENHKLEDMKIENINMVSQIQSALSNDRIIVYYQPIVSCKTRKTYKYEALVRIKSKEGNILVPGQFLELSQKVRMYSQITRVVINKVFEKLREDRNILLSFNISMEDILNHTTNSMVFKALSDNGEQISSRVTLEIVESIDINSYEIFNNFSLMVKQYKAKIAIDDFGAGYSNFAHLTNIKFDFLKIDGQFCKHISNSKNRTAIESIIMFCKKHNIKTIAEYVEDQTIFEKLCKLGIDYSQGYYFGKPNQYPIKDIPQ